MASYWDLHGEAVANWSLQDSSGATAADDSDAYPSALNGGFSFGSDSTTGPRTWLSSALQFDGVDDYVSIPSPATMALGAEHSLSVWFRSGTSQPWADQALIELGGIVHGTVLLLESNSVHLVVVHSGVVHIASTVVPDDGAWHHAVAVHRSTSVEIYLDGVLSHSSTMAQPWSTDGSDKGALGAVDDGMWVTGSGSAAIGAHFQGALCGAMIFRRALLLPEVDELRAGPEPTLVAPSAIPEELRVGERHAIGPSSWNDHHNGSLTATRVLQSSIDGATAWADIESTRDQSPLIVPLSVVGHSVRLKSVAANDGGESEASYSSAIVVSSARAPASLEAGIARAACCEAGVVAIAGCPIGKVLPGEGE